MTTIHSFSKAIRRDADALEYQKMQRRAARVMARGDKNKFYAATHLVQLYHGEKPLGEPRTMLGIEMTKANCKLERDFIASLDKGTAGRMYRWRLVKRDVTSSDSCQPS